MEVIQTRTFTAGADVGNKRLVKLSSGDVVPNTATSTDEPVGVADYAVASGDHVAVGLFGGKTMEIAAAGAISADAAVYAADDGKVQALPATAGTYARVGTAIEAATADGDIIEILPCYIGETETVS
jgi:hypothetical protein